MPEPVRYRNKGTRSGTGEEWRMSAASALMPMLNYDLTVGRPLSCSFIHRVHTERQLPLYGVHFIMMEKQALAG